MDNDTEMLIDINISENCCYSFLCDIAIINNSTINLIFYGYGTYCDCDCCFGGYSSHNFVITVKCLRCGGNIITVTLVKDIKLNTAFIHLPVLRQALVGRLIGLAP